jgi:hypothetical protein
MDAITLMSRQDALGARRDFMQQATDAGRNHIPATHTMAKKTLENAPGISKITAKLPNLLHC